MTENLRVCVCVSIYNNIIYRHIYIYVYVLLYIITYNNITAYSLRRAVKCSLAPLTGVNKSAWKIKKKMSWLFSCCRYNTAAAHVSEICVC